MCSPTWAQCTRTDPPLVIAEWMNFTHLVRSTSEMTKDVVSSQSNSRNTMPSCDLALSTASCWDKWHTVYFSPEKNLWHTKINVQCLIPRSVCTKFPDSISLFALHLAALHVSSFVYCAIMPKHTRYFGPNISSPFAVLTMWVTPSFLRKSVFMTALNPPWYSPPILADEPSPLARMQLGIFSCFWENSSACMDTVKREECNFIHLDQLVRRVWCPDYLIPSPSPFLISAGEPLTSNLSPQLLLLLC